MHEHIANLVISSNQAWYALKIIKSHGISHSDLINICHTTLISRLLYASCEWCGFATQTEIGQLYTQSSMAARWGMLDDQAYTINDMFRSADDNLFQKVLSNPVHVLFPRLSHKKEFTYNLQPRAHQYILPISSTAASNNFVQRMLFKHAYWLILYRSLTVQWMLYSFLLFLYMLFLLLWCKSYAYVIGLLKDRPIFIYLLT